MEILIGILKIILAIVLATIVGKGFAKLSYLPFGTEGKEGNNFNPFSVADTFTG